MLSNTFWTLFNPYKWEGITQVFGIIILAIFVLGVCIYAWDYIKWKKAFAKRELGHKGLKNAAQTYRRSFIQGSDEKTRHHADEFFELKRLRSSTAVVDSLPNTLVGLGILGTFVGLSIGVMGLKDQSSAEAIKNGVQELLGSMSTAFVTSVLGMASSLLLTLILRFMNGRMIRNHRRFCEHLDDRHYITDEQLSEIEQQRMRNMLLELFGMQMNDQQTTPGQLLIQNLQANQSAASKLDDFGVELAEGLNMSANTIDAIEKKLGDRFANLFTTHLGTHIESMSKSLESIDGKETSQAESFAGNLEASLQKLIEQFQEGLTSGAREEMTAMQQNLAATSDSLIALPQILEETKRGFTEMTSQFRELGTELGQRLAEQLHAASEQAAAAQQAGAEAAQKSLSGVAEMTSNVTEKMQAGMAAFMNSNAASVEGLNGLVNQIEAVIKENATASETIGIAITSLTSASKSLSGNTKDLDSAMSNMSRMNENMLNVSQSLSGVTSGLQFAISEQNKAVEQTFNQARENLDQQLSAYGVVNDELSKIKDAYIGSLRDYQQAVNSAVNSNLESFATQLGQVAEGLTSAYNALQETVGEMEGALSRQTKSVS